SALLLGQSAFGQGIATGSLSGTVTDPSGAAVPGAHVKAVNAATNQELLGETNETGFVAFRAVPPGAYRITITARSFRTALLESVEVAVARDTDLSIKLELGQVGETVQVEGAAPLIESSTAQITTSFSSQAAADLPLAGSYDQLTLLIPGVA